MAEFTVSVGFARGLLDFAVAAGASRHGLLRAAGIEAEALDDLDARLLFDGYVRLMRAAKRLTGDAALALHYGERVDIAEVSIIGLIGLASETMLDAFNQLNRYVPLVVETPGEWPRFQIRPERGGLWMVDTRLTPNEFPELTESAFAQLVCGPRRIDPAPFLKAVHVTHADPGYATEYERVFQAPVTFSSDRNAMQFDPAWPGHAVKRLPSYAFGVLCERADALLHDLERSKSVRGEVEQALMLTLHKGDAGMGAVAHRIGMSRATLGRRLKAEGVTFEAVLDQLRRRLATAYLDEGRVSVCEVAYLVGFSEPAAFSRAFKRWTGSAPIRYRSGTKGKA